MATRYEYGNGPMQYGEFQESETPAHGTVILIHGGFWRGTPDYFDTISRLGGALIASGWNVWQIEYRQLPNGGGWPATLDDTAAAIEHLAVVTSSLGIDPGPTVTVGHSAGGHLAVWALSRPHAVMPLAGAVSLAGVVNLLLGEKEKIGRKAVRNFLGGSSAKYPDRYAAADPMLRIDPAVPVRIVHGDRDDVVPMNQSETYVAAARSAGQDAALTIVRSDHMAVVEPTDEAFDEILVALSEIVSLGT